jgi:glutathione S-transferase
MSTLLLHTIPFSHYCELARWSLQRASVEFEERASLPGLHLVNVSQVQKPGPCAR